MSCSRTALNRANERRKQNGFECGMTRPGFSLLELLVAIALFGVVAALVVPNLRRRGATAERKEFIANLNVLTKFAWQNAITSGKVQKVEFDLQARKISILQAGDSRDKEGNLTFQPIKRAYSNTSMPIPASFLFRNFFVEKFDEMTRFTGRKIGAVWFYIVPEGLAQAVIINFVDTKDRARTGRGKNVGLVLNPFSAQFDVYDTFKQP